MNKKKFFIIFGLFFVLAFFSVLTLAFVKNVLNNKDKSRTLIQKITDKYPKCPAKLEGILTYPFIDPKHITSITPLGNINPPGHTSPVDHNYFTSNYNGKIPVYAPADNWIDSITVIMAKYDGDTEYKSLWYTLNHQICDGLTLTFANYTDLISPLKDIISKQNDDCKFGIKKDGHDFTEGQCYHRLSYKVKAGELIGWTQVEENKNGAIPFEIWAANYNQKPLSYVNWDYYQDDRYAHIMCTFDLYTGKTKSDYYSKFGGIDLKTGSNFTARKISPLCGQVNQDVVGTIQGMWFGYKPKKGEYIEFEGKGLAFLHNNIDPKIGEISIGGDLNNNKARIITFDPKHSGLIDREPSEVKNDGQVYCYNFYDDLDPQKSFLVKLIDNNHIKAEIKSTSCSEYNSFTNPYSYER